MVKKDARQVKVTFRLVGEALLALARHAPVVAAGPNGPASPHQVRTAGEEKSHLSLGIADV